jgi:hypothetical protein
MPSVIVLSVVMIPVIIWCYYVQCFCAEWHYAQCRYAECFRTEWHYASVIMLSVLAPQIKTFFCYKLDWQYFTAFSVWSAWNKTTHFSQFFFLKNLKSGKLWRKKCWKELYLANVIKLFSSQLLLRLKRYIEALQGPILYNFLQP